MSELVICFSNYVCAQAPARKLWTAWSRLVSLTSKSSDNLDLILLMHLSTDWSYSCSSVGTIFVASRACGVADTWRRYARSRYHGRWTAGEPQTNRLLTQLATSLSQKHNDIHKQAPPPKTNKQTNKQRNKSKNNQAKKENKTNKRNTATKSNKRTNKPYTGNQNKCKHNTKQTNNKQTTRNTQTHKQN